MYLKFVHTSFLNKHDPNSVISIIEGFQNFNYASLFRAFVILDHGIQT